MLQREKQLRAKFLKLLDGGIFAISLFVAHLVRSNIPIAIFGGTPEIETFDSFLWLFFVTILATPFVLELQGFYNRPLRASRKLVVWQIFQGSFWMVICLVGLIFFFRESAARSVILLFGPISFLLLWIKEEVMTYWAQTRFSQSQTRRRVILVGAAEDSDRISRELRETAPGSVDVVASLDLNQCSVEDLIELLHEHSANGVLITARHTYFGQVEKAIQACELEGVEAWLVADFFNTQVSKTSLDEFMGHPMLVFRTAPEDSWQKLAKQTVDIFGAFMFLALLSPFFLLFTILVKLTSPGPIFFKQQRSGLNGRPFTMLKFRSMINNAEQRKAELEMLNEMTGPVFKVTNDPRVTRLGRFMRKWSIDEWPQMLNVLIGDMSLVGPRPLPVDETRRFNDLSHRRRLSVKPGLTCLWQVNGRNKVTDFRDWVRLDLEYIDNWSLWLDFKILFLTIPVVIMGTGAK